MEAEAPPKWLNVVRFESIAPYEASDGSWDQLKEEYSDRALELICSYAPNMRESRQIRRYAYPPTYIEMKFPILADYHKLQDHRLHAPNGDTMQI